MVALFERVLQRHHEIIAIKYFTARVSGTSVDQSKPQRQDVYLRALRHYRSPRWRRSRAFIIR
jgi:hypothetical protein